MNEKSSLFPKKIIAVEIFFHYIRPKSTYRVRTLRSSKNPPSDHRALCSLEYPRPGSDALFVQKPTLGSPSALFARMTTTGFGRFDRPKKPTKRTTSDQNAKDALDCTPLAQSRGIRYYLKTQSLPTLRIILSYFEPLFLSIQSRGEPQIQNHALPPFSQL